MREGQDKRTFEASNAYWREVFHADKHERFVFGEIRYRWEKWHRAIGEWVSSHDAYKEHCAVAYKARMNGQISEAIMAEARADEALRWRADCAENARAAALLLHEMIVEAFRLGVLSVSE